MNTETFTITPGSLSLPDLRRINLNPIQVSLDPACFDRVDAAAAVVAEVIAQGRTVYGINTGFGLLANTRIKPEELETLQRSIVLSHAAGIGSFMDANTVRLLMVLKINSLARGYSGIRLSVIQNLIALVNAQVYPAK